MIGRKKLSAVYQEIREALAREEENPIVSLDREIRKLKRNPKAAQKELTSLVLVRNALARAVQDKLQKRVRPSTPKSTKKAI